jgi:hypothetical protein
LLSLRTDIRHEKAAISSLLFMQARVFLYPNTNFKELFSQNTQKIGMLSPVS